MRQRQKIEHQLIEKAMKDPDFRKRLVENPKAVIEMELGVELPQSLNVRILEEDAHTLYLFIPLVQARPDESELTEEELELLAGGRADSILICTMEGCPPSDPPG